jgi:hypothetical protein
LGPLGGEWVVWGGKDGFFRGGAPFLIGGNEMKWSSLRIIYLSLLEQVVFSFFLSKNKIALKLNIYLIKKTFWVKKSFKKIKFMKKFQKTTGRGSKSIPGRAPPALGPLNFPIPVLTGRSPQLAWIPVCSP